MKKTAFILFASALLLGLNQGNAGWVYEPDTVGDQEIALEDEIDLSQILGKIEEDSDSDSVSYSDEELLPWGIDDSKNEELSSFVEEHVKEAYRDYEESFALDAQAENREEEEQYPTMERVPSRSASLVTTRPKIVESKPKEISKAEVPRQKERVSAKKRVAAKKSPRVAGEIAKKKSRMAAKPPRVKQSEKSVVRKERKAPSTKSPQVAQKKKHGLKNKKGAVANRAKRQRPTERLAQNEE